MIKTKSLFAPPEKSDGTRIIISGIPAGYLKPSYDEHYSELAPTKTLLYDYKYHGLPWEDYEVRFFQLMKGRRAQRRIKELAERSKAGEVITLLCYEKTDEKCHRRLVKNLIEQYGETGCDNCDMKADKYFNVEGDKYCPRCATAWLKDRNPKVQVSPRKRLFIIDGYLHLYRAYHAPLGVQLTSPTGEPTNGTYIFTTALLKLIREQKPDALVVAMEGKSKPFRNELYAEYKANRTRPTDDFILQRDKIEKIVSAMNIPILRVDGFEADDIIGTVAKKAQADGFEVFVCSSDKDMLQLVDLGISIFNMKTGEYLRLSEMIERIGVMPSQFIDYLALQGDPGDNIPGIPGVGPKTAAQWISKYGNIENLIEHVDELKNKKKLSLLEFKDQLFLSRRLATIVCDVPISFENYDFTVKEFNKDKLKQLFTELGFTRLLTQLRLK